MDRIELYLNKFGRRAEMVDCDSVSLNTQVAADIIDYATQLLLTLRLANKNASVETDVEQVLSDLERALFKGDLIPAKSESEIPAAKLARHLPTLQSGSVESVSPIQEIADRMFGGETRNGREIMVRLVASTQSRYYETVTVPEDCEDEQLEKLVDKASEEVPALLFERDEDSWERSISTGYADN